MKKLFIRALAEHTKDENERKVLEYLCSKEGSTTYTTHVLNKNLCLLDLLTIFKTCQPPVEVILSYLSRLLPRPYSIVNSQSKDPNKLKICFSVIDIGNNRKGLTTSWLENVIQKECVEENLIENGIRSLSINETNESQNQPVPIYIRKNINQFLLPEDIQTPLLLLGPGTGVAPFIGFLEERESNQTNTGDIWLYFGCRNPELDFIYKEELDGFLANGVLTRLCTAFSRVEGDNMRYIQDALLRDGEEVVKFIEKGAAVFICGDLKNMAAQIKETLVKCFVLNGNTEDEAEKYIADMQKDKRYFVDTWS